MLGFAPLGDTALGQIPIGGDYIRPEVGSFVIAGQSADLLVTRILVAETMALTITGSATELTRAPAGLSVVSGGGTRGLSVGAGGGGSGLRIRA